MIANYRGPSNHRELFPHLAGEKIDAVFADGEGRVFLAFESGEGICFCAPGGGWPAYWKVDAHDLKKVVDDRRAVLNSLRAQLGDLAKL